MSDMKFTPGPWGISANAGPYGKIIIARHNNLVRYGDREVAFIPLQRSDRSESDEQYLSDAAIIAAAPDMFSALEAVLRALLEEQRLVYPPESGNTPWAIAHCIHVATEALAKAKGEE